MPFHSSIAPTGDTNSSSRRRAPFPSSIAPTGLIILRRADWRHIIKNCATLRRRAFVNLRRAARRPSISSALRRQAPIHIFIPRAFMRTITVFLFPGALLPARTLMRTISPQVQVLFPCCRALIFLLAPSGYQPMYSGIAPSGAHPSSFAPLRSSDLFCFAQMIVRICSDRFVLLRAIILLCDCTTISRGGPA